MTPVLFGEHVPEGGAGGLLFYTMAFDLWYPTKFHSVFCVFHVQYMKLYMKLLMKIIWGLDTGSHECRQYQALHLLIIPSWRKWIL